MEKMGKIGNMRVTDDVDARILRFIEKKKTIILFEKIDAYFCFLE